MLSAHKQKLLRNHLQEEWNVGLLGLGQVKKGVCASKEMKPSLQYGATGCVANPIGNLVSRRSFAVIGI
jgi:hypothetical protein